LDDGRSVHELISAALCKDDEPWTWGPVDILRERGTREVLREASRLCQSQCAVERRLGVRILGGLGSPKPRFPAECCEILLALLERECDAGVIAGIVTALEKLGSDRTGDVALQLMCHEHVDVRFAVVWVLGEIKGAAAIDALIELTRDEEALSRDWATFELGSIIEDDTPEIRAALLARLGDEDEVTRLEAMVGLATRKDERVLPALREALSGGEVWDLAVEAAELMGDGSLLTALRALEARGWDVSRDSLADAIRACERALDGVACG
jgi:HEAT repeat protein